MEDNIYLTDSKSTTMIHNPAVEEKENGTRFLTRRLITPTSYLNHNKNELC